MNLKLYHFNINNIGITLPILIKKTCQVGNLFTVQSVQHNRLHVGTIVPIDIELVPAMSAMDVLILNTLL